MLILSGGKQNKKIANIIIVFHCTNFSKLTSVQIKEKLTEERDHFPTSCLSRSAFSLKNILLHSHCVLHPNCIMCQQNRLFPNSYYKARQLGEEW